MQYKNIMSGVVVASLVFSCVPRADASNNGHSQTTIGVGAGLGIAAVLGFSWYISSQNQAKQREYNARQRILETANDVSGELTKKYAWLVPFNGVTDPSAREQNLFTIAQSIANPDNYFNQFKTTIVRADDVHRQVTDKTLVLKDQKQKKDFDAAAAKFKDFENYRTASMLYDNNVPFFTLYPRMVTMRALSEQDHVGSKSMEYITSPYAIRKYVTQFSSGDYPHRDFTAFCQRFIKQAQDARVTRADVDSVKFNPQVYPDLAGRIRAFDGGLGAQIEIAQQNAEKVRYVTYDNQNQYEYDRETERYNTAQKLNAETRAAQQQENVKRAEAQAVQDKIRRDQEESRAKIEQERERTRVEQQRFEVEKQRLEAERKSAGLAQQRLEHDKKRQKYDDYKQRMIQAGRIPKKQAEVSALNGGDLHELANLFGNDEDCPKASPPPYQAPPYNG